MSTSEPLITWRVDHLVRSAMWCGVAACAVPLGAGMMIAAASETDGLMSAFAVSTILMAVAVLTGAAFAMGFGCLMFGVVAAVGTSDPWTLAFGGAALFVGFVLFDLSVTFRRSPEIDRSIWIGTAATTAVVLAVAAGAFALAHGLAVGATWDALLIPLAVLAIGLTARFLSDRHSQHFQTIRLKHRR